MSKRNYSDMDLQLLLTASAGRCHICNKDVMTDWRTHQNIKTAENAHIKSFSDFGPRADKEMPIAERNCSDNLLILCPTCHSTIDKKIAEGFYTVNWLKRKKQTKESLIKSVIEYLNDDECIFVKYGSSIGTHNFNFNDEDLYHECFKNGFFSNEPIINLSEDCNNEDIGQSIKLINDRFAKRVQRLFDNGKEPIFCLFARAPQPLLIYLGRLFNDKHKIKIFTSHRDLVWKFNEVKSNVTFSIVAPDTINQGNEVALTLNATVNISNERVKNSLKSNVDIWKINSSDIGVDKINNQKELKLFYQACVTVIDKIGELYGKEKQINVFSAVCNSLAITFGRSIFLKSHNTINIYDAIKVDSEVVDVMRLKI